MADGSRSFLTFHQTTALNQGGGSTATRKPSSSRKRTLCPHSFLGVRWRQPLKYTKITFFREKSLYVVHDLIQMRFTFAPSNQIKSKLV